MLTKMFLFESCFINADNGGPFETLQSATFGGPLGSRLLMLTMVVLLRRCNPQRLAVVLWESITDYRLLTRSVAPCQQMERVFNLPLALSMIK